MTTLLAVLGIGVLFAIFAVLGPAERSTPCGGKGPGDAKCDMCPLAPGEAEALGECPGLKREV